MKKLAIPIFWVEFVNNNFPKFRSKKQKQIILNMNLRETKFEHEFKKKQIEKQ